MFILVVLQAIEDNRAQNLALITTMVERRTDRAYPIFVQCLQQSGQICVADMLVDLSQEMLALSKGK